VERGNPKAIMIELLTITYEEFIYTAGQQLPSSSASLLWDKDIGWTAECLQLPKVWHFSHKNFMGRYVTQGPMRHSVLKLS